MSKNIKDFEDRIDEYSQLLIIYTNKSITNIILFDQILNGNALKFSSENEFFFPYMQFEKY